MRFGKSVKKSKHRRKYHSLNKLIETQITRNESLAFSKKTILKNCQKKSVGKFQSEFRYLAMIYIFCKESFGYYRYTTQQNRKKWSTVALCNAQLIDK